MAGECEGDAVIGANCLKTTVAAKQALVINRDRVLAAAVDERRRHR
jgi:hypothetical protein